VSDEEGDEKTEVMYGIEYIINKTLQTLSKAKYRFDNCGDVRHPSIIVTTEPVRNAMLDLKNTGIIPDSLLKLLKLIYITARSLCKLLARFDILMELRKIC
jgi:hypothetical protein